MIHAEIYKHLNTLSNHYHNSGNQIYAIKLWFMDAKVTPKVSVCLKGFKCFAKNESMERWRYSGKIKKNLIEHEMPWEITGLIQPVCVFQTVESALDMIVSQSKMTIDAIKNINNKAKDLGCYDSLAYLSKLSKCAEHEHREASEVRARYELAKISYAGVQALDDKLYDEY